MIEKGSSSAFFRFAKVIINVELVLYDDSMSCSSIDVFYNFHNLIHLVNKMVAGLRKTCGTNQSTGINIRNMDSYVYTIVICTTCRYYVGNVLFGLYNTRSFLGVNLQVLPYGLFAVNALEVKMLKQYIYAYCVALTGSYVPVVLIYFIINTYFRYFFYAFLGGGASFLLYFSCFSKKTFELCTS